MSKIFCFSIIIFFATINLNAQTCTGVIGREPLPTKCFEIESILVNACSTVEGEDEMVRLRIGPNAIALNSINSVVWQTVNAWLGFCSFNTANLAKINTINNSISSAGNCGRFIPVNPGGTLPAYAKVLFLTSMDFNTTTHNFSGLTDTMYVIAQCAGNTGGHFTNSGNAIRTLIIKTNTCGDTVSWNSAFLIKVDGTIGTEDGATVSFSNAGLASYVNYGCAIPIVPFSCDAGTTQPTFCSGTSASLAGSVSGVNCYVWQVADTSSGTFTDSTNLLTNFNIKAGYIGSVKLYLKARSNCTVKKDSIMFNVVAFSGSINAGNDTILCNKNNFNVSASTSAFGPINWTENGFGSLNFSNIINPVYTPTSQDIGIVNLVLTQTTICGVLRDTVKLNFNSSLNPNFTIGDSNFCFKNIPININLNPTLAGGVFSSNLGSIVGNTFTFNVVGNLILKYKIGIGNCADSMQKNINSYAQPNSNFTLTDTIVCRNAGLISLFPATNGGVFSGLKVVGNKFTPDSIGIFLIKYKISNGICSDSTLKNVVVNSKLDPNFTYNKTLFCLNDPGYELIPNSLGGIFSGTNIIGNIFYPNNVGIFSIKYKVSNAYCVDSALIDFEVKDKPNANFTLSDTLVCVGSNTITLIPKEIGGIFTGNNVLVNIFSPVSIGKFPIKYTISNLSCSDSSTKSIDVINKPDASFNTSDSVFCLNDPNAIFTPTNTGGVFSGTNVNGATFKPITAGSFIVKHLINSIACADSAFKTINVFNNPTANFTFQPNNPTVEDTVQFTYTGANATDWLWRFDDISNSTSILQNPLFLFTNAKVYNTSLVVTNNAGCRDSISKTVPVLLKESLFIPNVFTPQGDGTNDYFTVKSAGINDFNMKIYNRWGGLVYETNQIMPGWDGTYEGNFCPVGVYFYIINAVSNNKKTYNLNGTVTLLR